MIIIKINPAKTFRSESINRGIIALLYANNLQYGPHNHGKLCFEQIITGEKKTTINNEIDTPAHPLSTSMPKHRQTSQSYCGVQE